MTLNTRNINARRRHTLSTTRIQTDCVGSFGLYCDECKKQKIYTDSVEALQEQLLLNLASWRYTVFVWPGTLGACNVILRAWEEITPFHSHSSSWSSSSSLRLSSSTSSPPVESPFVKLNKLLSCLGLACVFPYFSCFSQSIQLWFPAWSDLQLLPIPRYKTTFVGHELQWCHFVSVLISYYTATVST